MAKNLSRASPSGIGVRHHSQRTTSFESFHHPMMLSRIAVSDATRGGHWDLDAPRQKGEQVRRVRRGSV
jgi:hypothetical protein